MILTACAGADVPADSEATNAAPAQGGWAALTDWDAMPLFKASTTREFTSHQRDDNSSFGLDPGNKDFNSFLAVCGDRPALLDQEVDGSVACEPGELGYLIAADEGPGFVSRMSITVGAFEPGLSADAAPRLAAKPGTERIRIYVDGVAAYDGALADWSSGSDRPFEAPLAGWSSGTTLSYVPISYARTLRIFLDDLRTGFSLYYPHVTTHSIAATQRFDPAALSTPAARSQLMELTSRASGSVAADRWFDATLELAASATLPVWTRERGGTVQRVQIALATPTAHEALAEIVLRVYWDSDETPAIDLPLAALFGTEQELISFETWPMSVDVTPSTTTLSLGLPMPFARRARLEVAQANGSVRELQLRIDGVDTLPNGAYGQLHATRTQSEHPSGTERFVVAELSGRGKYIGTLMQMKGRKSLVSATPDPLNFLEGDEMLEVDGIVSRGIGTEDYFGGGWYFLDGPFSSPFAALVHKHTEPDEGLGEITALRWNATSDAINFQDTFRLSFEYGANMPATADEYSAVSFYYR
jgi:hypothetical protein